MLVLVTESALGSQLMLIMVANGWSMVANVSKFTLCQPEAVMLVSVTESASGNQPMLTMLANGWSMEANDG
jgi:hypothetical protein